MKKSALTLSHPEHMRGMHQALLPLCPPSVLVLFGMAVGSDGLPPPSAGHSLVYHDRLGMVLLINAGLGSMNDSAMAARPTTIYGWKDSHWMVIDSSGPPLRNLAGVAYDSRRDALVLHGGTSALTEDFDDTWEWTRRGWQQRDVPGPDSRNHTQMAYDSVRGRSVLFGGQATMDSFPADTWEWDGIRWTRFSSPGPPPRVHHSMAFDGAGNRVLLFGGFTPSGQAHGDLWAWDGSRWSRVEGVTAPPRSHAAMAYAPPIGGMVVCCGMSRQGPPTTVLTLGSQGWNTLPLGAAGPRYLPAMAYDKAREVLVLFGGGRMGDDTLLNDTWENDGTGWVLR